MVIDYNNLRGWKLSDLLFSPSLFRSSSLLDGTMMMMINAFAWLYQSWIHTIVRHFRYLVMSIHSDVIFTALFGKTACFFFLLSRSLVIFRRFHHSMGELKKINHIVASPTSMTACRSFAPMRVRVWESFCFSSTLFTMNFIVQPVRRGQGKG